MVALMTFANTVDEDFLSDQSTLSVSLAAGHFGAAGCQHDGLASPTALAMAGIAGRRAPDTLFLGLILIRWLVVTLKTRVNWSSALFSKAILGEQYCVR